MKYFAFGTNVKFFVTKQERQFKDDKETRRQANIQELVTLKESEKQLQRELNHYKEQLRIEQQKYRNVTEKVRGLKDLNVS